MGGTPPRYGALPGAPSSRACVPRASPICACAGEEQNQPQFTVLGLVAPVEMKLRLTFEFAVIGLVAPAGFAFEPPLAGIGQVATVEFGARVDLQHEDSADIPLAGLSTGPLPCTSPHSKREAALRPAFESAHADRPCSPAICQWRRSLPTYPRMTMQEGTLNQPRLPMLMQERAFYYHHERPHQSQSHSGVSSVSPGLPYLQSHPEFFFCGADADVHVVNLMAIAAAVLCYVVIVSSCNGRINNQAMKCNRGTSRVTIALRQRAFELRSRCKNNNNNLWILYICSFARHFL